jgi:hypothetical protein
MIDFIGKNNANFIPKWRKKLQAGKKIIHSGTMML